LYPQVVFAYLIRVFDYVTDVVSSGAGLVAPLRRIDCAMVPKETNATSASAAKLDDLNVLYQQVRLVNYIYELKTQSSMEKSAGLTCNNPDYIKFATFK
jgi:hypothetical protein